MTVVSFVEGATRRKGGIGLVGVPMILSSTANRGHQVVLVMGGPLNPGREEFLVRDPAGALTRKEGAGAFGIVTWKAWTTWAFAPVLLWRMRKFVSRADCVSLHSLYSFPVLAGYLLARWYRKPYGLWPHGVLAPFQRRISARKKWLYDRLIARRILNQAAVLFYSARGEREEATVLGLLTPSVIVPHGVEAGAFAVLPPRGRFRKRFFPGHEGELVMFLARLNAKKGLDLLIGAMARVVARRPQARLAIVGPPDPPAFAHRVLEWVRESGLESVVALTGAVVHDAKLEALADADVFVLPSQAENFGFSVFEAMASRIPVVVSDTLNYAGEIAGAGAGLAVARDPDSFSQAILRLLEDFSLRRAMGAKGLELAMSYSWEQTGIRVERTFESILEHRPLPDDLTA